MSVEWRIEGREFVNCNCAYGCPCQFNARPTHGDCRAASAYQVDRGHFGDVPLDGLRMASFYAWPGAVHEGDGTMQLVIDRRADARQREALVKIMSGEETADMKTMWWVFSAMCPHRLPPIVAPIDLEIDVERRHARVQVPGVLEITGEAIRNPVTGAESRARIDLPFGFEYRRAEIASGTTRSMGDFPMTLTGTHGHFAHIHLGPNGVIG